MQQKIKVIATLIAMTILATTAAHAVYAEKQTDVQTQGSLIPSKHQSKSTISTQSTEKLQGFNWNDCSGTYKSGWFDVWLPTPQTNQVTYKWLWPQYEKGGWSCGLANFQSVQNYFTDIPQG